MKKIKKIDFKCIEINLEFKEHIITIKVEPYRTLDYLKEKTLSKILDLPPNINYYYQGKDLSEFGSDEKIGNIFKNREKVTIKLKSPLKIHNAHHNRINSLSPKNKFNNKSYKYFDNSNNFLNNNLYRFKEIKKEEKNYKNIATIDKSLRDEKLIKLFNERIKNINIKNEEFNKNNFFPKNKSETKLFDKNINFSYNKSETKLPMLKANNILNNNTTKNRIFVKKIKNEKKVKEEIELLCDCERHNISEYCRNCRKFICVECKTEQKHRIHSTIRLNTHKIEENVKKYGRLVQDDIQKKIDMNRSIFTKIEVFEHNMLINRKERIINKYQEVINIYQKLMTSIDNKLKNEDKERTTLVINAYNDLSQKMNKQLLELLEKLNNNFIFQEKKILFNDLRSFFDEINSKEETLSFLGKDIIKYHLKNEINTKLKSSLDKIDRILDEITDDKNPFNLSDKFYEELIKMEIIKLPKEIKEKDLNNNSVIANLNKTKIEDKTNDVRNDEKNNNNNDIKNNIINENKNNNNNKIFLSKFAPQTDIIPEI